MSAIGALCRLNSVDSFQENAESSRGEVAALHERLVAYVHAIDHGSRRGVWGEHSYARGGRAGAADGAFVRTLLAPPSPSPPPAFLDVERASPPPPPPPPPARPLRADAASSDEEGDGEGEEEEWEARVAALAGEAHAALAATALGALRALRLERLAARPALARDAARAAARRLRRALAHTPPASGPVTWLHCALSTQAPARWRRLYAETLAELRRSAPRAAARLAGAGAGAGAGGAARRPPRAVARPLPPDTDPWLVWVSSGCAALDARWERRLAAQVHTRVLRPPAAACAGCARPPEAWCAHAAGAVRDQLTDALAEAGSRSIILGGVGAGAALCLLLARGAGGAGGAAGGVRGAVLAGLPLATGEGGRAAPDDALHACRLPLLLVAGARAADCPPSAARAVCAAAPAARAARRRLLLVAGADAALRLPSRARRAAALPQDALDAALVEEVVRWAVETAAGGEGDAEGEGEGEGARGPAPAPAPGPAPAPAPGPAHRRHPPAAIVRQTDLDGEEEYAHLPQATPPAPPPAPPTRPHPATPATLHQAPRSIEISEGRVVSRAAGGTPLTLLPPRRAPSAPPPAPAPAPPAPPSAADIMQMPIVFADDTAAAAAAESGALPAGSPLTVTSGRPRLTAHLQMGVVGAGAAPLKMTRVIVAKRGVGVVGARGASVVRVAPAQPRPPPGPRGAVAAPAAAPQRRLVLRRGVRILPRQGAATL